MKDSIVFGFTGGILGTLADEVIHWLALWLTIAQSTTGHLISQLMFPNQAVSLPKLLTGELTHILAGGVLGTLIVVILKLTGNDSSIIKGAGFGVVTWMLYVNPQRRV